jgi:phage-related protein
MDLFKLLGTIAVDNDAANKALSETSSKAKDTANDIGGVGESGEKSGGKFGAAMSKMGGAAVKVGKAVATGMAVGGAAVTALATKSIQAYADYEQLVGGVETLFKDSAGKVQEYARNAYKTAGMSANEYMETVTSFSASLLQSLDGDTAAAAEKADMAITDMSDNANKMGTDITMIQNAYQGFAKQNYTMLDNLKLGYGGTKEEMQRLLEDAEKLSGKKFDLSSYADIVDAIHVVQTEMGITGTTAKEASSTISGSIASMKASWSNLMVAMSDDNADFGSYVNSFVESVSTVADNLMPRITVALNGVVQMINSLAPVIIGKIPELFSTLLPSIINAATGLINALVAAFPGIVQAITSVIPQLINGFRSIIDGLISAIPTVLQALLDALPEIIPVLINAFFGIFDTICATLPQIIQPLLSAIPGLIEQIVNCLLDNVWNIIDGILLLATSIIDMLPTIIPLFVDAIMEIVRLIVAYLPDIIPELVNAIIQIVNMLGEQLPVILPMLTDALVQILVMLTEQLPVLLPMIIQACIDIVNAIIDNLPTIIQALITALPAILQAVWNAIVMIFQNLPQWFGQLFNGAVGIIQKLFGPLGSWFNTNVVQPIVKFFTGLWDGICSGAQSAWDWICGICSGIALWVDTNIIQPVVNFFIGLWDGIKAVWDGICNAINIAIQLIGSILSAAFQIITLPFQFIWENCKEYVFAAWEWIKNAVSTAINAVKNTITNVMNAISSFLSPILNAIKNTFTTVWNAIKNAVSTAVNAVKSVVTTVFNAIKSTATTVWNAIKNAILTVWNAIKNAVTSATNAVKNTVSNAFNAVKSTVTSIFNAIKSTATSVWNGIKNAISNVVNGIKNTISNVFNSVKNTVGNIFNSIKEKMSKPIEQARDLIKGIIDKIKGFFGGMKLEFPKIKLPHFGIKPQGWKIDDLLQGSIPTLGIEWYAKAMNNPMVMKQPTIFGYNPETGALQAGGEAGSEVVAGANTLMGMIGEAVARNSGNGDSIIIMLLERIIEMLAQFFPDILDEFDRFMPADPDDVAGVLAVPMNRELGRLALKKGRGR